MMHVPAVGDAERRPGGGAELADQDASARPGDPQQFGQPGPGVVHIAQAVADRHRVEAVVGERQRQRVAGHEPQIGVAVMSFGEHAERQVGGERDGTGSGQRFGRGAGAGSQIEDALARLGCDCGQHGLAPEPDLAEGHQVVHQVVTAGNVVEHAGDIAGLLIEICAVWHPTTLPQPAPKVARRPVANRCNIRPGCYADVNPRGESGEIPGLTRNRHWPQKPRAGPIRGE